jgi:hypothetical protein
MDADVKEASLLADDCYHERKKGQQLIIGGIKYSVLAVADRKSGYQATAYQRTDNGHVIIAERGTEFGREPIRDGVRADGGMVRDGVNSQYNDAIVFTEDVIREAKKTEQIFKHPITYSTTGHSLGGTLAQVISHKYNFPGVTFNAYGAAGLNYGIPEGGHLVKNYIVATDLVSAASPHFGETHIYASQQDVDRLKQGRYIDSPSKGTEPNPFMTLSVTAHRMGNFLPNNDILGQSLIGPENEARAQAYTFEIDAYRSQIQQNREVVATYLKNRDASAPDPANLMAMEKLKAQALEAALAPAHEAEVARKQKIAHLIDQGVTAAEWAQQKISQAGRAVEDAAVRTSDAMDRGTDAVKHAAIAAGQAIERTAINVSDAMDRGTDAIKLAVIDSAHAVADKAKQAGETLSSAKHTVSDGLSHLGQRMTSLFEDKPTPNLNTAAHPDHIMYRQALDGVKQLDASQGRTPDHRSERLAASLTVAARKEGLGRIDHVLLSDDVTRAFAIEGSLDLPSKRIAQVDTALAVKTPIEQHSRQWQHDAKLMQEHVPARQMEQPIHQPRPAPAM